MSEGNGGGAGGLTVGSLFSGIGGLDLGLERAGMRVVWQCEIDEGASGILAEHWPHTPNLGDITKVDFTAVPPVDVLAGGFMCTDLSISGYQKGLTNETRSGITWAGMVRAIRTLRPRYVLVENVSALLTGGDGEWFGIVLSELAACGYDAEWDCIPATAVGAPHIRDRVFIIAYPADQPVQESVLARAYRLQRQSRRVGRFEVAGSHWEADQPSMVGMAYGLSGWVDVSRALGNAVVPQVAELIGGWIVAHAAAMEAAA
jgi:DNA (cytosine-5)-methyltransferase 1